MSGLQLFARSMVGIVALCGSMWSTAAAARSREESDAKQLEAAPLSLRGTRAAPHPDCGNRVPMWMHDVQAGENLGVIAGRYGVRRRDLAALNRLEDPNLLRVGQRVRVCPEIAPRKTKTVRHSVQRGETLSEIAASYELTVDELLARAEWKLADRDHVRVGQVLELWVDDGIVEAFAPPLPKRRAVRGAHKRSRSRRVVVQLQPSQDVHIKRPHLAFGTAKTIALLERVVAEYKRAHRSGPRVLIGNISRRGGGKLKPHLSHRRGVDIDVGYVLKGEGATKTRFEGVTPHNFDAKRTWTLIRAFLDTGEIRYIFMDYRRQKQLYNYAKRHGASQAELEEVFQYPRGRGRNYGIIRHWRSHRNHFHVRFRA